MVAEHLQQWVLDELAGRSLREERRTIGDPGVADRGSAGNGLDVATFSVGQKIAGEKIHELKISGLELAGSVPGSALVRGLPRPLPLYRVSSCRNGGPR